MDSITGSTRVLVVVLVRGIRYAAGQPVCAYTPSSILLLSALYGTVVMVSWQVVGEPSVISFRTMITVNFIQRLRVYPSFFLILFCYYSLYLLVHSSFIPLRASHGPAIGT